MNVVKNSVLQYSSLRPGDVFAYSLTDIDCESVYMVIDEVNDAGFYKHIDLGNGGVISPSNDLTVIKLSPTLYLNV